MFGRGGPHRDDSRRGRRDGAWGAVWALTQSLALIVATGVVLVAVIELAGPRGLLALTVAFVVFVAGSFVRELTRRSPTPRAPAAETSQHAEPAQPPPPPSAQPEPPVPARAPAPNNPREQLEESIYRQLGVAEDYLAQHRMLVAAHGPYYPDGQPGDPIASAIDFLLGAAERQLELGDCPGAVETLSRRSELHLSGRWSPDALWRLLATGPYRLLRCGWRPPDFDVGQELLFGVFTSQVAFGEWEDGASELLPLFQDSAVDRDAPSYAEAALAHIAVGQAQHGRFEEASRTAGRLETAGLRAGAYLDIAKQLSYRGRREEALAAAERALPAAAQGLGGRWYFPRSHTLAEIAFLIASLGEYDRAVRAAEWIPVVAHRQKTQIELLCFAFERERNPEYVARAISLAVASGVWAHFHYIAVKQAAWGDPAGAERTARLIETAAFRERVLKELAERRAAAALARLGLT